MVGPKGYHVDDEGVLLLDENGQWIDNDVCLCFAHSASECCCGAWGIEDYGQH